MSAVTAVEILRLVIGVLGIVGNTLVMYAAWKKRKDVKPDVQFLLNPFLLNLTFMDLVSSGTLVITFALKLAEFPSMDTPWFIKYLYCLLTESEVLIWPITLASTTALVVLTLERYIMVLFPLIHKNRSSKRLYCIIIVSTWIIPILIYLVNLVHSTSATDINCMITFSTFSYFYNWVIIGVSYVLPILVFIGCYSHMVVHIHKITTMIAPPVQPATFIMAAKKKVIVTMALVCATFIITWSPIQIYFSLALGGFIQMQTDVIKYQGLLCLMNSIVNPLIYAFRIKDLRETLYASIYKCKQNSVDPEGVI